MREVIVLAKGGDREALGRCLDICRNYLLEVARLRLPSSLTDRLGASDLVQDVYLACCTAEKFREFRGETEEELLAWTRQVLLNLLVSEHRRHTSRRRDVNREVAIGEADGRGCPRIGVASPSTSPSGKLIGRERREIFLEAIEELDGPNDREIMKWRYLLDLSFHEIATMLEMSKSYVVNRHAACIAQLRSRFARAEGLTDVGPRRP
jgi:RNA polymerase sigma-70 factor, ECF subfamily